MNQRHPSTAFFAITAALLLSRVVEPAREDRPAPEIGLSVPCGSVANATKGRIHDDLIGDRKQSHEERKNIDWRCRGVDHEQFL